MPATVDPRTCGACRPRGTRPRARRAASPSSRRWPTCEPGRYDVALVARRRARERTVPGDVAAAPPRRGRVGRATRARTPRSCGRHMFDRIADGVRRAATASTTRTCARSPRSTSPTPSRNPNAQTRALGLPRPSTAGPRRRSTPWSRAGSGATTAARSPTAAAGVVLVSDAYLRRHPHAASRAVAAIAGWGHRTVGPVAGAEARPRRRPTRTCCRTCATPSTTRSAGPGRRSRRHRPARDPRLLHAVRVPRHRPHRTHRARRVVAGRSRTATSTPGGRLPVNPSGGLIGGGHPVGATGVRMVLDAAQAGHRPGRRVPGGRCAPTAATLNIGGSTATTRLVRRHHTPSTGRQTDGRRVVGRLLTTLPEDDDHPYRTGPWRPQTTEWRADDLDGRGRRRSRPTSTACTCATPRTRCTRAIGTTTRSTATAWCTRSASATATPSTATGSSAPTGSSPSRRPASRCGPGSPSGRTPRCARTAGARAAG